MSDYDKSIHTNPDAMAWAKFFIEMTKGIDPNHFQDESYMVGWFANSMMAMHDHLRGNPILNGDHAQFLLDQQKNQHTVSFRFDPSGIRSVSDAFSKLRSDNEQLRSTLTMGAQVNTPDFLDWIADRLVNVHAEPANVDFVLSLRERASAMRAALASDAGEAA